MRKEAVCAVDLGTSHIKAALVETDGTIRGFSEQSPPAGVEFDVDVYLVTAWQVIRSVMAQVAAEHLTVYGVIVTNQRATVVPVDEKARALGPALSWQDTRGDANMARFIATFGRERFIRITGLPPSALWTLAKLLWLRENAPDWFQHARFALLHDYALACLGADTCYTDPSNASLTGMLDLAGRHWSAEILAALSLAPSRLSALRPAGMPIGTVSAEAATATGLPSGTPLLVGGGDQQCGALGIGALDPGTAGVVLGTAAVVSCPTTQPVFDETGHLFCTAHAAPGRWVIEGIHNTFGSSAGWLADVLRIDQPQAMDALAAHAAPGASGVCFFPFQAGIGSPDFNSAARGAFLGLHLATSRADLIRAVLEGMNLELRRVLESIASRVTTRQVIAAGGGAMRLFRVQMLADLLGHAIQVNPVAETTLLGAALLAWTSLGYYPDLHDAVARCTHIGTEAVAPRLAPARREAIYARYCRGVNLLRQFHLPPEGDAT